jgi:small-conductance mechanosensitive channel
VAPVRRETSTRLSRRQSHGVEDSLSQPPLSRQEVADIGLIEAFELETGLVAAASLAALLVARLVLGRMSRNRRIKPFLRHSVLVGLTVVALVATALTLRDPVRDQTLKFLGIVFSAVLAFSSTTLVGNALAGVMLRAQSHFRGGDWVTVGDLFGQVSQRGLLFTTVQNELRDLVTLPNSYLASNPITVVAEPTYISARVSLGYDVPRTRVERLLLDAATDAGLERPYVYVLELGDYSVQYRVAGKLMRIGELLTRRSELRCRVLDALHAGNVEIVSPAFMNQRVLPAERRFVPEVVVASQPAASVGPAPEVDTFDRGRQARTIEQLEDALRAAVERSVLLESELDRAVDEGRREELRRDLAKLEQGRERLLQEIQDKGAKGGGK